jgi:C_GCAxxG_C_C family probable redox protein
MDFDTAMKIATPFGAGMGQAGQICGAISGGLLAIGLLTGISSYDRERKYACYNLAQEFQNRFIKLHGDLTCP